VGRLLFQSAGRERSAENTLRSQCHPICHNFPMCGRYRLSRRKQIIEEHFASVVRLVAPQNDLWSCTCGHESNTFETGGVCPACLQRWTDTQCLSCARWSPHSDWYAQ
jgi:hypothetical protein